MNRDAKLRLEAAEGHPECPSHKPLVDVLLAFEKRLGRMEVFLLVGAAAALGTLSRDLLLPLLLKIIGAGG